MTNAHKLTGKLLLTVGEIDSNVDPASTMQVVNALIKADKDFELIVFPNGNHGAGGGPYGVRRRKDFFVKNLLGVEPPNRNEPRAARTARAPVEPKKAPPAPKKPSILHRQRSQRPPPPPDLVGTGRQARQQVRSFARGSRPIAAA